jgi:hypothetical protein
LILTMTRNMAWPLIIQSRPAFLVLAIDVYSSSLRKV